MKASELKTGIEELGDGRSLEGAKVWAWLNRVRKSIATDPIIAGFRGIYFLYKEATVQNGSQANVSRYLVPDDYILDLNVFYAGKLLAKVTPGILEITRTPSLSPGGEPTWVRMQGREFDIQPTPSVDGDEIKLFYNGVPDLITGDESKDCFSTLWEDLHIYGAGHKMRQFYGFKGPSVMELKMLFEEEKQKLMLHNRAFHFNHTRIRLLSWDEFQEQKTIVFPQYRI